MWKWREHPGVIARVIPKWDIRGFLKQDVIIGPSEAVVLIRNGVIEEVLTETRMKKVGGGFRNWAAKKLSVGEDLELLFIKTTPIDLEIGISSTSKDYEKMKGTSTLRIQLTPQNATKIINFMGKNPVILQNIFEKKIESELVAKVFSNRIAKYNTEEFHGNINIQKDMESVALIEMRKTFELWGINLLTLYTNWERGAYDELMEYKRKVYTATQRKDIDLDAHLRDLAREHEGAKRQIQQEWQLRKEEILGEEGLKTTRVSEEVKRGQIIAEGKLDVERKRWELEEQQDQIELKRALEAKAQLDALKIKRFHETELARQKMEQDFKTRQMAMQTDSTEKIMEQALDKGAADSKTVQEMMRQQTMQKMADRDAEKVRALSEAEKARYEFGTYKEAEEREREYETKRMDLTAKQMEAAKQKLPETFVQGATSTPVITPIVKAPGREVLKCPNCGSEVDIGGKICTNCGTAL